MRRSTVCAVVAGLVIAGAVAAQEIPEFVVSQAATFRVDTLLAGLESPVAMTFLPDGRAILVQGGRRPARRRFGS